MATLPQKIYFDESGFTGNNLLHPSQQLFSYASVATDDDEAREMVNHLVSRYQINSGELKGSRLLKFSKGRKAVNEIFEHFEGRLKISISNKKFALACKFHEYIFEPCYSEINSLFYEIGFHRFIANILYVEFVARAAGAEEIFSAFEEFMRTKDERSLDKIFSSSVHPENSPILVQIREFAQYKADAIRTELHALQGGGPGKWILDLTVTAIFTLLANWGTEHEQITAICDPSKPLQDSPDLFNAMVNRSDRVFSDAFGERHPITFNLSAPIQFADSKISHGIQIADAVAAAAVYVFSGANDEYAIRWRSVIAKIGHYGSIVPDLEELRLSTLRAQRNAVLLTELHDRARTGKSMKDGMAAYIRFLTGRLIESPIVGV